MDAERNRLVTELPDHCDRVVDRLARGDDELFDVIVPILGASYAEYIRECHLLRANAEADGRERLDSALDRLASDLEDLDIARQYFTTAFVKEELAILSRSLLYVSVVSISAPIALLT